MSDDLFVSSVKRFNEKRDFSTKAFESICYAPFVSLYFDQFGDVRVCCQNINYPVGNITQQSLDEIWNGVKINTLRDALPRCDMQHGCQFCERQFIDGNTSWDMIKQFDVYSVDQVAPTYPKMMEFSISNTCNLECVMCNGNWSSSIRTRREKKQPLPKVYGDGFFEQLRPFLPHLDRANFFGGEPFLEHETYRIWEMMIELGLKTTCCVTTNGTQYNAKVEKVINSLPFIFNISMDGATKETLEKIRKNANFETVMDTFKRFHAYSRKNNSFLGLTYCLMVPNWHEFGDFLMFADEWDVSVYVNTVTSPSALSLYDLPLDELCDIVVAMESMDKYFRAKLTRNCEIWINELSRLRNTLNRQNEAISLAEKQDLATWGATLDPDRTSESMNPDQARALLTEWAGSPALGFVKCNEFYQIIDCDWSMIPRLRLTEEEVLGRSISDLPSILESRHGKQVEHLKSEQFADHLDDVMRFINERGSQLIVRAISIPLYDQAGHRSGLNISIACRDTSLPELVSIDLQNGV